MQYPFDTSRVLIAAADGGLRQHIYKRLLDRTIFSDTAADAGYALQRLASTPYGVVLLDLSLPAAENVVTAIGKLPEERRPVVLVLANPVDAHSLDVDVVQVVLRKPVNLMHLVDMVSSCVRVAGEAAPAPSPSKPAGSEESAA